MGIERANTYVCFENILVPPKMKLFILQNQDLKFSYQHHSPPPLLSTSPTENRPSAPAQLRNGSRMHARGRKKPSAFNISSFGPGSLTAIKVGRPSGGALAILERKNNNKGIFCASNSNSNLFHDRVFSIFPLSTENLLILPHPLLLPPPPSGQFSIVRQEQIQS